MFGSSNNLNHIPGYISSQKKVVATILQVGAGGVIAGFSTTSETCDCNIIRGWRKSNPSLVAINVTDLRCSLLQGTGV